MRTAAWLLSLLLVTGCSLDDEGSLEDVPTAGSGGQAGAASLGGSAGKNTGGKSGAGQGGKSGAGQGGEGEGGAGMGGFPAGGSAGDGGMSGESGQGGAGQGGAGQGGAGQGGAGQGGAGQGGAGQGGAGQGGAGQGGAGQGGAGQAGVAGSEPGGAGQGGAGQGGAGQGGAGQGGAGQGGAGQGGAGQGGAGAAGEGGMAGVGGAGGFSPLDLDPLGWWDLSASETLFQNIDGSNPVTAANQPIGRIADRGTHSNHLKAPSNDRRPLYKTDGGPKGNSPAVQFDGVLQTLTSINFTSSDTHVFVVCRHTGASGGVWGRGDKTTEYLYKPQSETILVGGVGSRGGTQVGVSNAALWPAPTAYGVFTSAITPTGPTTVEVFRDGQSFLTSSASYGTTPLDATLTLGATHSGGADGGAIVVLEAIVYGAITGAERQKVEAYLKDHWGTP